jgi:hypothetical protein
LRHSSPEGSQRGIGVKISSLALNALTTSQYIGIATIVAVASKAT